MSDIDHLELRRMADRIETVNGIFRPANTNVFGHLYRLVEGLEDLAHIEAEGNPTWEGYLRRAAVASERLAGITAPPGGDNELGYWKRITLAFEALNLRDYGGVWPQQAKQGVLGYLGGGLPPPDPDPDPDPPPIPAPEFGAPPSIAPTAGLIGTEFSAFDGIASNTTSYERQWLLGGLSIGTGTSVIPAAPGELILEVVARGPGGARVVYSLPVTVSAIPEPEPDPLGGQPIGLLLVLTRVGGTPVPDPEPDPEPEPEPEPEPSTAGQPFGLLLALTKAN